MSSAKQAGIEWFAVAPTISSRAVSATLTNRGYLDLGNDNLAPRDRYNERWHQRHRIHSGRQRFLPERRLRHDYECRRRAGAHSAIYPAPRDHVGVTSAPRCRWTTACGPPPNTSAKAATSLRTRTVTSVAVIPKPRWRTGELGSCATFCAVERISRASGSISDPLARLSRRGMRCKCRALPYRARTPAPALRSRSVFSGIKPETSVL